MHKCRAISKLNSAIVSAAHHSISKKTPLPKKSLHYSTSQFVPSNNKLSETVKTVEHEKQLSQTYPIIDHTFDVVVVGAGGAGLMCAIQLAKDGYNVACISKTLPSQSQTSFANEGIAAALGNMNPDDWRYHAYDTLRGGDFLGDQDAIQFMCKEAPQVVNELEEMGLPLTKQDGKIYQRSYGNHSTNYGKGGLSKRACMAEDKTGQFLIETTYETALRNNVKFFIGFFAMDLLMEGDDCCRGVMSYNLNDSTLHRFKSHYTVLATGGYGRAYSTSASSPNCTGDGTAMVSRAGLQNQDMEFVQFKPTGVYKTGHLVESYLMGEFLLNGEQQHFMQQYADIGLLSCARAITKEIHEERGCGPRKDYIHMHFDHLYEVKERFPHIAEIAHKYAGVDISKEPIPVLPTSYFTVGGVPTDYNGQVISRKLDKDQPIKGLMAAGEVSNISVHGATSITTNRLTESVVFGRACAHNIMRNLKKGTKHEPLHLGCGMNSIENLDLFMNNIENGTNDNVQNLKEEMQNIMQNYAAVYRTNHNLACGVNLIKETYDKLAYVKLKDKSQIGAAFELQNLLINSVQTLIAAENRKETRGCHVNDDYTERDDVHWLKHTLTTIDIAKGNVEITYRPVHDHGLDDNEFPYIPPFKSPYRSHPQFKK